jgi:hypothetical protein
MASVARNCVPQGVGQGRHRISRFGDRAVRAAGVSALQVGIGFLIFCKIQRISEAAFFQWGPPPRGAAQGLVAAHPAQSCQLLKTSRIKDRKATEPATNISINYRRNFSMRRKLHCR